MLVVVDIGAVLEEPVLLIDGDGDDPVVLPGGVVEPSRVALVLPAELALGVAGLGRGLRRGNGLGVLLRLGQVDGDVQFPVGCGGLPLYIPGDAVTSDVVRVLTEAVEPVRRRLRGVAVLFPEALNDLRGAGRQYAHQLRVEKVAADRVILYDAPRRRVFQQLPQDVLQGTLPHRLRSFPGFQLHSL